MSNVTVLREEGVLKLSIGKVTIFSDILEPETIKVIVFSSLNSTGQFVWYDCNTAVLTHVISDINFLESAVFTIDAKDVLQINCCHR